MHSSPLFKESHGAPAGRAMITLSSFTLFGPGAGASGVSWANPALPPSSHASAPSVAGMVKNLVERNAVIASAPAQ
jgi:hypothetical protein